MSMQPQHPESSQRVQLKVLHYLRRWVGEVNLDYLRKRVFVVNFQGRPIEVDVRVNGQQGTIVSCYVAVGRISVLEPTLLQHLLEVNLRNTSLGAFALEPDGTIAIVQHIPGESLDFEEIKTTIISLSKMASRYSNGISQRKEAIRTHLNSDLQETTLCEWKQLFGEDDLSDDEEGDRG